MNQSMALLSKLNAIPYYFDFEEIPFYDARH